MNDIYRNRVHISLQTQVNNMEVAKDYANTLITWFVQIVSRDVSKRPRPMKNLKGATIESQQ